MEENNNKFEEDNIEIENTIVACNFFCYSFKFVFIYK